MRDGVLQKFVKLVFVLVLCGVAQAQSTCYTWNFYGASEPTGGAYADALNAAYSTAVIDPVTGDYISGGINGGCYVGGSSPNYYCQPTTWTCSPSGAPTGLSQTVSCPSLISGTTAGATYGGTSQSGSCPSCSGSVDILDAIGGSTSSTGGLMCYNGCEYYNGAAALKISAGNPASAPTVYGQAVADGNTCSTPTANLTGANCMIVGGTTMCAQASSTPVYASVGPDSIAPGTAPAADHCLAYPDGSTICNATGGALTSPPAPGSSGVVAAPTAVVQAGSTTEDYFASGAVASSAGAVGGSATTSGGVSPGVGAGGGAGVGNAPNAANGDCGAAGVSCTGAVPTIPTVTGTYASTFEGFWTAIQSAPLLTAVAGLETAWPSGSCPAETVTIVSLNNLVADYGTPFCSVWNTYAAPNLATVMIIVWSLVGIFIILSA